MIETYGKALLRGRSVSGKQAERGWNGYSPGKAESDVLWMCALGLSSLTL